MIINSILENDLYKFSMSNYYQVHYPNAWGTFTFHDRNNTMYSEEFVVDYMSKNCPTFASTSTVSLAMKYGIKPIGTMAHECFMFQTAIHTPKRQIMR